MNWPVQDAKSRFSELLAKSISEGRGSKTAYPIRTAAACAVASRGRSIEHRMYLLDTNVVSELRRVRPNPAVVAWLAATPDDQLFLAAVTLGELQAGVEITRAVFRRWAQLMHRRPGDLIEDAMIAATALVHNLTVVTRNLRDFERLQAAAFDPFR